MLTWLQTIDVRPVKQLSCSIPQHTTASCINTLELAIRVEFSTRHVLRRDYATLRLDYMLLH